MSTDPNGLGEILRVLQEAEQRVRFPVGGGVEIGAANDIAGVIAKLKKLAATPPEKLHVITVEPTGEAVTHYVAVLAENATLAVGRALQHLGVGVAAVTPLVVYSGVASIPVPRSPGKPAIRID
jgi:hypothetical protein